MRAIFEFVIAVTMFGLMARTWCAQSFEVPTGSMASAIRGVHRQVTCDDCRWAFAVGSSPEDGLSSYQPHALCPNCGAASALDTLPDQSGDRLLVNRAAYWARTPQRWQLAVFQDPERGSRALVKRVVGLPGEVVAIAGGNVYIDGQLARKSLEDQRAMAVPVHDAAYQSHQAELPLRWRPVSEQTNWRHVQGTFRLRPQGARSARDAAADETLDWLAYHHWRRWPALPDQVAEAAIDDTLGYNQGVPITDSSEVDEILLACNLSTQGTGQFVVRANVGGDEYRLALHPSAAQATLTRNGKLLHQVAIESLDSELTLEFSTIDRQILCALNSRVLFPPVHRREPGEAAPPIELAIGGSDIAIALNRLQLFRDVYYTSPRSAAPLWGIDREYRLGPGEYFVLGDNSHISHDSRYWADSPAVSTASLIGQAIVIRPTQDRCCLLAWLGL